MRERGVWGRKSLKKERKKDEWVCGCGGEKVLAFPVFSVVGDETLTKDKAPKSPHISVRLVDNGVMKMEIFGGLQKGICGTAIINWPVCEICLCACVCM